MRRRGGGSRRRVAALALAASALWAGPVGPAEANDPPTLEVAGGSVRPDRTLTLTATASDPNADPADAAKQEDVQLDAAFAEEDTPPAWLTETTWTDGPEEFPELEIGIAAPADAQPAGYTLVVSATDGRGLTTQKDLEWDVLAPLCGGALEFDDDGTCAACRANHLPNVSKTACVPCGADTERPGTAAACTACPAGLTSEPGEDCRCGTAERLQGGVCVACPDHADSTANPYDCAPCAADHERPAGVSACRACPAGQSGDGGSGCLPTLSLTVSAATVEEGAGAVAVQVTATVGAAAATDLAVALTLAGTATETADYAATGVRSVAIAAGATSGATTLTVTAVADAVADAGETIVVGATLAGHHAPGASLTITEPPPTPTIRVAVDSATLAEDAGKVSATLTLADPPASGRYTGCGLRLAAGGVAGALDVEFTNGDRTLEAANGWSATGKLLKLRDDALAEGDETLVVEGHCTGSDAGTDPAAADLAAAPLTLTVEDNEALAATLSVDVAAIDETASATAVEVTATLGSAVERALDIPLTFGGTAAEDTDYTLSGTRTITVDGGASTGATTLTFTPSADADADDDAVVIGASPAGYAVTAATLTIREPPPPPTIELSVDSTTLPEDAGDVNVRLTLANPPAGGKYTGCRVRLAAGSGADAADVGFMNRKKLRPDTTPPWSASARLLTIVDDDVEEGDETLLIEGYCSGSAGADPPHDELLSTPLALTIEDDDRYLALAVSPDEVGETRGEQSVTVTGSVATPPVADVVATLDLDAGDYTVTGTRSLTIAAGATDGSTTLAVTPTGDADTTDDEVSIGGEATGYTVRAATLTIGEPTLAGDVDLSGLRVRLSVAPTAIREGTTGTHTVTATLTGVPVPAVDVALVPAVGGTAVQGASHDYTLAGPSDWPRLTVSAGDAHATASADVTVAALPDPTQEGGETVTFSIGQVTWGATAVALDLPAVAVLTITEAWDTPAAPGGLTASPTAGNETRGLTMSWDAVTAVPAVEDYTARHRKRGAAGWTETPAAGTSAQVSGLKAGTEYEVRAAARNAKQLGGYSDGVYAFTAPGDCLAGAPSATSPSGDAAITQLALSWAAPVCGSTIASYRIRYREDAVEGGVDTPWSGQDAAGTTATLRSLAADTAYVVQVMAVASNGDRGPWSAAGRGRTAVDTRLPPRLSAPSVAPNASMGGSRLDATWTRVAWIDGQGVSRPVATYQYRYREESGTEDDWTAPVDATAGPSETAALTRTIEGLAGARWHLVQVRGVNRLDGAAHAGRWSEPGRGRTWGVPDRVAQPTAFRGDAAVDVLWTAPDDGGSAITGYLVQYRLSTGGWLTHAYDGCVGGTCATEAAVNAAAARVRVAATNATGTGEWSPAADVRAVKLLRVSYGAAEASLDEGRSLLVTVRLNQAADRSVAVPLTTEPVSGPFRIDGAPGGAVVFAYGTGSQAFSLVATQDVDADDETVTLGFGDLPDAVIRAAPASLAVDIADDDAAPPAPAECAATTTGHCELPATTDAATAGGTCEPGYGGACSYSCADGTWTVETNTCAACTAVDGGWSAWGACSATACGQTGTRTRTCTDPAPSCGGARCAGDASEACTGDVCSSGEYCDASGTCRPGDCDATTVDHCELPAADDGAAATGACGPGYAGSCGYTCARGVFGAPSENTCAAARCGAVRCDDGTCDARADDDTGSCDAGDYADAADSAEEWKWTCGGLACSGTKPAAPACGADPADAADACDPGTYGEAPLDTYADGACGTAANSCDGGVADESPADPPAVHGACGTAVDGCAAGSPEDVDDTAAEHLWNCLGEDGGTNWSCTGTAGNWNWSCTSGGETIDSCSTAKTGTTATGCTSPVAADDAACGHCKAGHERCGGACLAQCGTNEVRNADTCACECADGYHPHNGTCVEDPACATSPTGAADACDPGTYGEAPADTYRDGACGTAANSCAGGVADESPADPPAVHGACGTAVDGCAAGSPEDVDDTAAEHLWNCLGEDGGTNWSCTGTAGNWNWSCTSGGETIDSCSTAKTGTTATGCTSPVAADDAACGLCKAGHERCGGACVAQCGTNEVRNADTCACECADGYHPHNGTCVQDASCNVGDPEDAANACTAGTYAEAPDDTYEDGDCATAANTCDAGDPDPSPANRAAVDGACGTDMDGCTVGTFTDVADTTAEHLWNCLGKNGETNWSCTGTSGAWNWSCANGAVTVDSCSAARTGSTATGCTSPIAAADARCGRCRDGYHRDGNRDCVPNPVCTEADPTGSSNACTVGAYGAEPADTYENGSCARARDSCASGEPDTSIADTPARHGRCGSARDTCAVGYPTGSGTTDREYRWTCEGEDGRAFWTCEGTSGNWNWSCSNGNLTIDSCSVPWTGTTVRGCSATLTARDRSCSVCKPEYQRCGGSCLDQCGTNEVRNSSTCGCVCENGYHIDDNGACVLPCNADATRKEDACAAGSYTDPPDDTYRNGACRATKACRHGVDADTSPVDVDPEHGVCGSARGGCDGGAGSTVERIPGGGRWSCTGIDGATKWNCPGTSGEWNWSCTSSGVVIGACTRNWTGATKKCSSAVDASDASCIHCDPGYHEHNGACVEDPGCDEGVVERCEPEAATHGPVADTLVPPVHKWRCTHGGMTEACMEPAPGCGTNKHYEIDGGNDLRCVCDAGFTACANGDCHQCGLNEVVDRATCGCVCENGYHIDDNGACVLPCNADATSKEDACAAGSYTDPPDDTYRNGACREAANSCAGGTVDTSPRDDQPVAGFCGSAPNTCRPGTPTSKSETDSEYLWTCEGADGTAKWNCLGTAGKWNWTCTTADTTAHACMAPRTGSDALECPAPIEAADDKCGVCKSGYTRVEGVCQRDCDAATIDRCVLPATPSGDTSGSCDAESNGACSYKCNNGEWTESTNGCVAKPALTATIEADPNPVEVESTTTVSWDSTNATSGSVTCRGAGIDYSNSSTTGSAALTPGSAETVECRFAVTGRDTLPESTTAAVDVVAKPPPSCASLTAGTAPTETTGCESGQYMDGTDSNVLYWWTCSSVATIRCRNAKAAVCGTTAEQCVVGNPGRSMDQLDPPVEKWRCINGPVGNRSTKDCSAPFPCDERKIPALDDQGELFCDFPPSGCRGAMLIWTGLDLHICSAYFGPTEPDEVTRHLDTFTATDSDPLYTGSATFTCDDGVWTGPTGQTCVCGAQCACVAAGGTWIEALPERPRTCEGNDGCAGHTHSCTTPADPAGGYRSCTYKKHKGGFACASHSHRTCHPYPATTAHCHFDLGDVCPICAPPY